MSPDPAESLETTASGLAADACSKLNGLASSLPELIKAGHVRSALKELDVFDVSQLEKVEDFRVIERAFQIYAHFANAYVWCDENNPADHIPKGVAVPLVVLSKIVERPPILPYATTSLSNFRRLDPAGDLTVDNLACIQKLVDIHDESWFHLIHVEIEAHAAKAVHACIAATKAIESEDATLVESELARVPIAFGKMIDTFKRIAEKCSPDIYYFTLRPYLFGFTDVVYEGVDEFEGAPQTFRGESGAQSSVIPSIKAYLGLQHESGGLTEHLEIMKSYMPKPHRELLAQIDSSTIRSFVIARKDEGLKKVFNECIESVFEFRSLHLRMANGFIAKKVANPIGTGGTEFMYWLKQLRDETAQQYL